MKKIEIDNCNCFNLKLDAIQSAASIFSTVSHPINLFPSKFIFTQLPKNSKHSFKWGSLLEKSIYLATG